MQNLAEVDENTTFKRHTMLYLKQECSYLDLLKGMKVITVDLNTSFSKQYSLVFLVVALGSCVVCFLIKYLEICIQRFTDIYMITLSASFLSANVFFI